MMPTTAITIADITQAFELDAAPLAHLVVDTDPRSPAAVVGLDGAVLYGAPARCPTCGGVILLDGPVEGPSAELACAMRACPRHAGSAECGGRLW